EPEAGLFNLLGSLLTNSPLFVTAVSWRTGSSISDPNAVAFRSVLKGSIHHGDRGACPRLTYSRI
ncbi:hypothetical protein K443DRAFT_105919, partial [Laccaria amethystina LaAM-08-1]